MTEKWRIFGVLAISMAAALTLALAGAAPRKTDAAPAVALNSMKDRCPGAVADEQRVSRQFFARRPSVKAPTNPSLRMELLRMARADQSARIALIRHGMANRRYNDAVNAVDAKNLRGLRHILGEYGFPTPAMVGYDGLNAAFLLLQHQSGAPAWQRKWLAAVKRLARRKELSPESYAMFVDRVRLNEGRKQIYGSQFKSVAGRLVLKPVVDPSHLDERRKAIGIIPEEDYECLLDAMYDPGRAGATSRGP